MSGSDPVERMDWYNRQYKTDENGVRWVTLEYMSSIIRDMERHIAKLERELDKLRNEK